MIVIKLKSMQNDTYKVIANNKKATFEYFILERFEAGISLVGSEIKSIRAGQISINEAFVEIRDGREAWLLEAHIAPYLEANRFNHEPKRDRRLLLNKNEIGQLWNDVRQKGMTIVPLKVYIKNGKAKVEIGLAKGKKLYDKRQNIAERDAAREDARNRKYGD